MQDRIALVSPLKSSYSETFVQAHIDLLDFKIHHFYSLKNKGYYPIYDPNGKALFSDMNIAMYSEALLFNLFGNPHLAFYFREKAFVKYLRKNKIKAVLTEFGPTAAMLFRACAKINVPIIAHFHGRDAHHFATIKKYEKLYRKMFGSASTIVAVSNVMKEQLVALGCPPEKIIVNPCGPNSNFNVNIDITSNQAILLSTGRFVDKKAPLTTIQAFSIASKKCPELRMVMLADGYLWEDAKALTRELNLEDRISFPGPVKSDRVLEYLKSARAFVQHSVRAKDGDSEGTPVSILEAMLLGLPVISTRHAGIIDISVENKTALLTDENDVEKMAEHMIFVANEAEKAAIIGKSAKAHVEKHFTMKHHIDKLNWAIQAAIDKNKAFI